MKYKTCAFATCTNRYENNPNVGYFMFPRNEELRRQWLEVIQNPDVSVLPYDVLRYKYSVCGAHFLQSHFQTSERQKLNRKAVPIAAISPIPTPESSRLYLKSVLEESKTGENDIQEHASSSHNELSNVIPETDIQTPGPSTIPDVEVTYPEKRQRDDDDEEETPKTSRPKKKIRLIDLGVNRVQQLTPKKQKLYKHLKKYEKLIGNLRKKVLCRRKLVFTGDKAKNLLNDPTFTLFDKLSPAGKIFVTSQLKHCGTMKRSVMWIKEEKALSLAIYKSGPKGYRFLKKIFKLPSQRTLQRELNNIHILPGINESVFTYLSTKSRSMPEKQRYCVMMFDEVYLLPNLSINLRSKSVDGLENLGEGCTPNVANHALVFMLRGINQKWKQPIAFYFVKSATKTYDLKNIVKTVIQEIHEKTAFRILATISDQGSANVAAVHSLSRDSGFGDDFVFTVAGQKIVHLFDPPHLIKCFRNQFLKKNIHFENKIAKWSDLEALYELDGTNPDSKICKKLTEAHIRPEGRQKMKVRLASQVFSRSVYAAFMFAKKCGALNADGTAEIVLFMDQLFDSLNSVRNSSKPLNRPLTDTSPHQAFWNNAKKFLANLKFKKDGEFVKPPPSVRNLIVTMRNIQSLWKTLKGLGFKYLATRCLNQDPLENFFGVIRGLCGQNFRPSCSQFLAAYKTSLVNNLIANSNATNCEHDGTELLVNFLSHIQQSEPSKTNPTAHYNPNLQPSTSATTDISKEIYTMKYHTSSYIAGFICKKILKYECQSCLKYFISEQCTDSHALIKLREFGKLHYPSSEFIGIIDDLKDKIFHLFFQHINATNIFSAIGDNIDVDIKCCMDHDTVNNHLIKTCIMFIMFRHIITIINRKMALKDKRPNNIIDSFLKIHGAFLYHPKS